MDRSLQETLLAIMASNTALGTLLPTAINVVNAKIKVEDNHKKTEVAWVVCFVVSMVMAAIHGAFNEAMVVLREGIAAQSFGSIMHAIWQTILMVGASIGTLLTVTTQMYDKFYRNLQQRAEEAGYTEPGGTTGYEGTTPPYGAGYMPPASNYGSQTGFNSLQTNDGQPTTPLDEARILFEQPPATPTVPPGVQSGATPFDARINPPMGYPPAGYQPPQTVPPMQAPPVEEPNILPLEAPPPFDMTEGAPELDVDANAMIQAAQMQATGH